MVPPKLRDRCPPFHPRFIFTAVRSDTMIAALAFALAAAVPPPGPLLGIHLPKQHSFRFIVTGDAGTGDPHLHDGIVSVAKRKQIDGILLAGDNVYPCGVESSSDPQWSKVTVNFGDTGIPIYPVLGNHDYGDPTRHGNGFTICGRPSPDAELRATGKVPHWSFPARTYELTSPLVDILMIDTQPIASGWSDPFLGSETAASEVAIVDSALTRSDAHWRIVVGHHTIFSSGERGRMVHTEERNLRAMLLPALTRNRVSLYICGHDHDAELIGSLRKPMSQPLFLIAGNGAASLPMQQRTAANEPATIFPTKFPPQPLVGFALLEIGAHTVSVTFYDGSGQKRSETYVIHDNDS